jgi:catechol 2,3-dioxygenase-like lactoylglutathione lyase family enzyme
MTSRRGFLHLNLNVSSLETSVRFYRDALGFRLVHSSEEVVDFGSGPETVRQVVLTIPSSETLFALTQARSLPIGPGGLNHLGLILASDSECSALAERVLASGGSVQKSGLREAGGISEAFAYVCDPDGYALELSTQAILYDRILQSP